jgi:hypothetical protein
VVISGWIAGLCGVAIEINELCNKMRPRLGGVMLGLTPLSPAALLSRLLPPSRLSRFVYLLHYTLHYTTQCTTLHYTTLHYTTLLVHYTTLHYTTLPYIMYPTCQSLYNTHYTIYMYMYIYWKSIIYNL